MSKQFLKVQLPLMLIAGSLAITLVAWKQNRFAQADSITTDTLPKKEQTKIKNFDDALEQLEKAQIQVEQSLKNLPTKDMQLQIENALKQIDVDKIKINIDDAMKQIDAGKINAQIESAMKHIDAEEIKKNLADAMKEIHPEEIKAQLAEAMKEIDIEKTKAEVNASIAKIDMEKIKANIEEMKKTELPKIEAEMKKIKPQIDEEIKKAKVEIDKAKVELREYKAFEDGLEKDGLINKKENYKIEHKDGQLIINGKAQPQSVYNKYRSFLEKHKNLTIEKNEDDFKVKND